MKYGALTYTDIAPFSSGNIGDYIQSLAAIQFLPRIDIFLERENLKTTPEGEEIFVIMNGWFMHRPENFPPPKNIRPFYISFCVADEKMLSPDAVEHLKKHGPIGCRDYDTVELLRAKGVPAYFSGCLTLTFENFYKKRNGGVYLVDVKEGFLDSVPAGIRERAVGLSHEAILPQSSLELLRMGRVKYFAHTKRAKILDLFVLFRRIFSWRFRKLLPKNDYRFSTFSTFLNLVRAQSFLDFYAQADLVITSRLHVALPCLAFSTPVILFKPHYEENHDRFTAVKEYLQSFSENELGAINWYPQPPQVEAHQKFLRLIVREAVLIGDNPLKNRDLEYFYKESGWYPSSGVL